MENSLSQFGREGVYEHIGDVICSVRPVYKQIWPNFTDVQYLFFASALNAWVIGDNYENCNETTGVFRIGVKVNDGSSFPNKVKQPWLNYVNYAEEDRWEEHDEMTVICDGEYSFWLV